MARLTLSDARSTMGRGRPWTFRLECTVGGRNAFWLATGRSRHEPVEIHYGAIGNKPQILVKDWAYVERKAPEKEAKGYVYVDTPFVKVQPSTIAAAAGSKAPTPVAAPKPVPKVKTPTAPTPEHWRCNSGGLTMRIKGGKIEIVFDKFPASWQTALYGSFKDQLTDYCTKRMGRPISTWWGGSNSELFQVHCAEKTLFKSLVVWLQQQIGVAATPLVPAPKLSGPYGKVVEVAPKGKGVWHALSAAGDKVFDLTTKGARDLVAAYPHIKVAGL